MIYYYASPKGEIVVKEFIENLTIKEQAKIFAYL